jgi:hypothetical protein
MEDDDLDMTEMKMEEDDLDMSDMKMDEKTETSKAHQHK